MYICSLEKEMATHSNILACRTPLAEEPGSPWGARVRHDLATKPPPYMLIYNVCFSLSDFTLYDSL